MNVETVNGNISQEVTHLDLKKLFDQIASRKIHGGHVKALLEGRNPFHVPQFKLFGTCTPSGRTIESLVNLAKYDSSKNITLPAEELVYKLRDLYTIHSEECIVVETTPEMLGFEKTFPSFASVYECAIGSTVMVDGKKYSVGFCPVGLGLLILADLKIINIADKEEILLSMNPETSSSVFELYKNCYQYIGLTTNNGFSTIKITPDKKILFTLIPAGK